MTPTSRSLRLLRRQGFLAAVVESWIPHANLRRDLFGFADVLAVHPARRTFLLVQVTTIGHIAHRLTKAKGLPGLTVWLRAGGAFEVHGWDGRRLKRVEVRGADLADVVIVAPRRRGGRGHRQGTLFG
jgi:hypothetical protein